MQTIVVSVVFFVAIATVWAEKSHIIPLKDLQALGSTRIISGQPAAPGQFPWQVVNKFKVGNQTILCGGALICDRWVLTAAHCAQGASSFTIYLGSVNRSQAVEPGRVVVETKKAIVHEDYNKITLNNDVALIDLQRKVNFTDKIKPIRLSNNYTAANLTLRVSGWGKTKDGADVGSPVLYFVDLRSIPNKECEDVYGKLAVVNSTICCRGNPEHSTCKGDSGGPLVQRQSNGQYVHVGVVSFVSKTGCASGNPSAYARTASYLNWIKQKINGTCQLV